MINFYRFDRILQQQRNKFVIVRKTIYVSIITIQVRAFMMCHRVWRHKNGDRLDEAVWKPFNRLLCGRDFLLMWQGLLLQVTAVDLEVEKFRSPLWTASSVFLLTHCAHYLGESKATQAIKVVSSSLLKESMSSTGAAHSSWCMQSPTKTRDKIVCLGAYFEKKHRSCSLCISGLDDIVLS